MKAYYAATFRLLGFEPETSGAMERIVDAAENRLGRALPKSVRQWYARNGAIEILAEHSNDDPLIPIERFAVIEWQSRRLLPFRNENQGVCTWAVDFDGSDYPPVYVDVDSGGKEWQLLAPTFSTYVFSCVWDHRMVLHRPALVQAQNRALSESVVEALTDYFRQEIRTHGWPGKTQYRFTADRGAILIWSSERQADWFIGAPESVGLELLLGQIWDLGELGASLYGTSQVGRIILDKLRLQA